MKSDEDKGWYVRLVKKFRHALEKPSDWEPSKLLTIQNEPCPMCEWHLVTANDRTHDSGIESSITCPECDAPSEVTDGQPEKLSCPSCGFKVLVKMEVTRTPHMMWVTNRTIRSDC